MLEDMLTGCVNRLFTFLRGHGGGNHIRIGQRMHYIDQTSLKMLHGEGGETRGGGFLDNGGRNCTHP